MTECTTDLLGVVVDQLAIDEDIDVMGDDLVDLGLHLLLLSLFDLRELGSGVDADARAKDLDLISVHRRVGDEDLCILDDLGLRAADLLVEEEALIQV